MCFECHFCWCDNFSLTFLTIFKKKNFEKLWIVDNISSKASKHIHVFQKSTWNSMLPRHHGILFSTYLRWMNRNLTICIVWVACEFSLGFPEETSVTEKQVETDEMKPAHIDSSLLSGERSSLALLTFT